MLLRTRRNKKEKELENTTENVGVEKYDRDTADKVLCTALDIGESMLKCGGEIHRVEDTITRICKAYDAEHIEVFSIPSLIVATVRMKDGSYSSQVRRILSTARELNKLELYNRVSRKVCAEKPDFDTAQKLISGVKESKSYPWYVAYLGAALTTGAFTLFFKGGVLDAIGAIIVGLILTFIDRNRKMKINLLLHYIVCSFAAGMLAMLMAKIGLVAADKVIIGAIMLMVPGLSLDCALRDMLCGDLLSGTLGLIQSLLLATMIAVGLTASIVICGGIA